MSGSGAGTAGRLDKPREGGTAWSLQPRDEAAEGDKRIQYSVDRVKRKRKPV
ncbi:hypothetical protein CC1G_15180 [Coprinopsis cinerea okayama7|uniref:Uncharacterized protein n=1 Tax=Coprinopsis cinerea (strain Okayama-7 / 130 / ATCC MYA-4618 / FGSC 9003) TaxID=240176 RepID=D6RPI9_COPC7|nr:hypothetical protein CC1G_15180 [Coprinopsis cinerea okayama7\|eukprot:XP_002910541.1 hypothetical protein CC1G_15180 [Coprinopsis cinerea okayama7\